ncbi:MAG TPA: hypothetical protein VGI40_18645 [Pirellulaceae bacterium]|jgi:hypothetical protein
MIHISLNRKMLCAGLSLVLLSPLFNLHSQVAAEPASLKPLMAVPDKIILQEDYSQPKPLASDVYSKRQGTQWVIEDGVLRGRPSPPEFQAKKQDHQGLEARISIPACPRDFLIQFDVRFLGGEPTPRFPFLEFGHHMARLTWSNGGEATLSADGESVLLAKLPSFKIEPGRWYHALGETKGEEIVIQFADGPTIYGKHASLDKEKSGFGVCGTKGGTVELDNVTVWSVKAETQPDWPQRRSQLPQSEPTVIKKATTKGKAN